MCLESEIASRRLNSRCMGFLFASCFLATSSAALVLAFFIIFTDSHFLERGPFANAMHT